VYPHLIEIPLLLIAILAGGLAGVSLGSGRKRLGLSVLVGAAGALLAGLVVFNLPWAFKLLPVQSYGVMVLLGFLVAAWLAARRSALIGVAPAQCLDISIYGVAVGIAGARLFHVLMHWSEYDPFQGAAAEHIGNMFKLWDGGLVFYGGLVSVILFAWVYCRLSRLPVLPFLDLCLPSVLIGQAFGRIGCFLSGCCFGKVCHLPWAVSFPYKSQAYLTQADAGLLFSGANRSLPVHPTQLYASIAAGLTAAFLYCYWPRRRFNGEILGLALVMASAMRFFEEFLRDDDIAVWPQLSAWMTIGQWCALGLLAAGAVMWIYFKKQAVGCRL